jgi:hypothetical protein
MYDSAVQVEAYPINLAAELTVIFVFTSETIGPEIY